MIIIGAGMAGCIAAFMNRKAMVLEAGSKPSSNHRAVLRFRSNTVAEITGIPFRKVRVHKGIWFEGKFLQPTPQLANYYSRKVIDGYMPRSVWSIEPVDRYVAPSDFHEQMLDTLSDRIEYNCKVLRIWKEFVRTELATFNRLTEKRWEKIVSTMPMDQMQLVAREDDAPLLLQGVEFRFSKIYTRRGTVRNCDLHQTIYYPSQHSSVYRASLVGDQLIVESKDQIAMSDMLDVADSFGISNLEIDWEPEQDRSQRYGKIAPIDENARRNFMLDLTLRLNVFSLGRFATWKNILLDDVVDDMNKIQQMSDRYNTMKGMI